MAVISLVGERSSMLMVSYKLLTVIQRQDKQEIVAQTVETVFGKKILFLLNENIQIIRENIQALLSILKL